MSNALQPPPDTSTPKEPSSNELTEIEIDTKRMPPKQRRVRRKITLPAQITPTTTSQPQEQETSTVSSEKVAVIECSKTGELPSVDEPSEPENSSSVIDEAITEKTPDVVKKPASAKKASAKKSATSKKTVAKKSSLKDTSVEDPSVEEPSVKETSVEEPSMEEPSVEQPSIDDPSLEGPSVELPSVEDPLLEDFHGSQDVITTSYCI